MSYLRQELNNFLKLAGTLLSSRKEEGNVPRGRNETKSSSGEIVPAKQKTRTRRACERRRRPDVDADVDVNGRGGMFCHRPSGRVAQKLACGKTFREGAEEGEGGYIALPRRFACRLPLSLEKQFLFDVCERVTPLF